MSREKKKIVFYFIVFALLSMVMGPSASAGEGAECEAALVKCLFAYSLAFGVPMAITLCLAGYTWCLQFME